jgi:hypothetical protein
MSLPEEKGLRLIEKEGNLFSSPQEFALAHCVSRDFAMSQGIARDFKQKFGGVDCLLEQRKNVGQVAVLCPQTTTALRMDRNPDMDHNHAEAHRQAVFYLISKERYYHKPTYAMLQQCLDNLKEHCSVYNIDKLAIPRLGCGLDKLYWPRVKGMIEATFQNVDICIDVYYI